MFLLDSDALLCVRKVSLLSSIDDATLTLHLAGFVARHELSTISGLIEDWRRRGRLEIHEVKGRTGEHRTFRRLVNDGVDKGEAETMAWALAHAPHATFISLDVAARRRARQEGLDTDDVFGFGVRLVEVGVLTEETVKAKLVPWDDQSHGFGRPPDYTTCDDTWTRRVYART